MEHQGRKLAGLINQRKKEHGISQEVMAEEIGISRQYLSDLKKVSPIPFNALEKICHYFQVPQSYFTETGDTGIERKGKEYAELIKRNEQQLELINQLRNEMFDLIREMSKEKKEFMEILKILAENQKK